jgi:hypothetical protein
VTRDDYAKQGKQFISDLRDTVGKKVADNEQGIRGGLGKAARWVDQKTGGKYSEQIGRAEAKAGEGLGRVARQGGGPQTGDPQAPGAQAGAGTEPVTPPSGTPSPTGGPGGPGGPGGYGPPPGGPQASGGHGPPGAGAAGGYGDRGGPGVPGDPAEPAGGAPGVGTTDDVTGPVGPPTGGRAGEPEDRPTRPTRPTAPPRDDAADWPRPPQS